MKLEDYFTADAAQAIGSAIQICTDLRAEYVQPEHIFFALLLADIEDVDTVLDLTSRAIGQLRNELEHYIYDHTGIFQGRPAFASRTVQLFDRAFEEAQTTGAKRIGVTQLLISISQDDFILMGNLPEEYNIWDNALRNNLAESMRPDEEVPKDRESREKVAWEDLGRLANS